MRKLVSKLNETTLRGYLAGQAGLGSVRDRVRDEEGQGTAEYVAVIVLIASVIVLVMDGFGEQIASAIADVVESAFERVGSDL
jgi:Flp pilus assembly pilin Flp